MGNRIQRGSPEKIIYGIKRTTGGLILKHREIVHFTEGDPVVTEWQREYKQEPHQDLIEALNELEPHMMELCFIGIGRAKFPQVSGFTVKDWDDDAKATLFMNGKYAAQDGIMIPVTCPKVLCEASAYKSKASLFKTINTALEEARLYVYTNKVASPWTLFDQPRDLVSDDEPNGNGNSKGTMSIAS